MNDWTKRHIYSATAQGVICQCDQPLCKGFRMWQLTGRSVTDLTTIPNCDNQGATGPGRVYAGDLYMEQCGPRSYCLTLGNDSSVDGQLEQEWKLYNWAISEGYGV